MDDNGIQEFGDLTPHCGYVEFDPKDPEWRAEMRRKYAAEAEAAMEVIFERYPPVPFLQALGVFNEDLQRWIDPQDGWATG